MHRSPSNAYRVERPVNHTSALPALTPYQRCKCGGCNACRDNAKWDRIFAKFETKDRDVRGVFQSTLNNL